MKCPKANVCDPQRYCRHRWEHHPYLTRGVCQCTNGALECAGKTHVNGKNEKNS
jgi:hypothetical protein